MIESGHKAILIFSQIFYPDFLSDILATHSLFKQSPFHKACSEPQLLKVWLILNYCIQTVVEMIKVLGLLHTRTPLPPQTKLNGKQANVVPRVPLLKFLLDAWT